MNKYEIICGDSLDVLSALPDNRFQCCVTSPPYFNLRDYGDERQIGLEKDLSDYVAKIVSVFNEVKRALRPDGVLFLNIGDTYNGIKKGNTNGIYGDGVKDKSKTYSATDTFTKGFQKGLKAKDLIGVPWSVALELRNNGWFLRQDIIWHKTNPMPEPVMDRCVKSHEYVFLMSKSDKYYFDWRAIVEKSTGLGGGGFSKKTFNAQLSHGEMNLSRPADKGFRRKRSVWSIPTKGFHGEHFAPMPIELAYQCVIAGSKWGDEVLDPFCGSGTTGVVSLNNGRNFFGIELNKKYVDLAISRIDKETNLNQIMLF